MEKAVFQTRDISLTAYLISQGFKLLNFPQPTTNPLLRQFNFQQSEELEQHCVRYLNRDTSVDALTYSEVVKTLINQLKGVN